LAPAAPCWIQPLVKATTTADSRFDGVMTLGGDERQHPRSSAASTTTPAVPRARPLLVRGLTDNLPALDKPDPRQRGSSSAQGGVSGRWLHRVLPGAVCVVRSRALLRSGRPRQWVAHSGRKDVALALSGAPVMEGGAYGSRWRWTCPNPCRQSVQSSRTHARPGRDLGRLPTWTGKSVQRIVTRRCTRRAQSFAPDQSCLPRLKGSLGRSNRRGAREHSAA